MKSNVKIRRIVTKDLNYIYHAICILENELLEFDVFEKIFNENISNPDHIYLLAEADNESVGFISFHTQKLLHHCGLVGEIQEFYIDQNYRNQGIGRLLIEKIMNYAALHKLKSIEVTSHKNRTENIVIYENLGFCLSHNKFTIYT